jgi:hypothetical protein
MDDLVSSIKSGNVADAIVMASRLAREAIAPKDGRGGTEGRRADEAEGQAPSERVYDEVALQEKLALSRDTVLSIEESMRCVTLPDMREAFGPPEAKGDEIAGWRRRLRSHLHRVETVLVQLDSLGPLPPDVAAERKAAVDRMESSLVPVERMLRLLDMYEELLSLVHSDILS